MRVPRAGITATISGAIAILLSQATCSERIMPRRTKEISLVPKSVSGEPILAKVNGVPISLSTFQLATKGEHPGTIDLADLVRLEILVQEAVRRQLHKHPKVIELTLRAMVQRYLQEEFEKKVKKSHIPRPPFHEIDPRFVSVSFSHFVSRSPQEISQGAPNERIVVDSQNDRHDL